MALRWLAGIESGTLVVLSTQARLKKREDSRHLRTRTLTSLHVSLSHGIPRTHIEHSNNPNRYVWRVSIGSRTCPRGSPPLAHFGGTISLSSANMQQVGAEQCPHSASTQKYGSKLRSE